MTKICVSDRVWKRAAANNRAPHLTKGIGIRRHVRKHDKDVLLELVRVVFGSGEGETRRDDTFDAEDASHISMTLADFTDVGIPHSRRVIGQVKEEGDTVKRAILLEVLLEEARSLHVHTHSSKHDAEVVLVIIVHALASTRALDQTSLTTNLGCNLKTRKTQCQANGVARESFMYRRMRTSLCGRPAAEKMGIF